MLIPIKLVNTELMYSEWDNTLLDCTCILLYAPDVNKYFCYPGIFDKIKNLVIVGYNDITTFSITIDKIKYWIEMNDFDPHILKGQKFLI
jgi:hypothetical protein